MSVSITQTAIAEEEVCATGKKREGETGLLN
jgi:hypothetical protein